MSVDRPGAADDETRLITLELSPELAALAERYDILSECGRGGMGIVYKARDRQTNDLVAIKVLNPSVSAKTDLIDRFKNELVLARKVTHKNVCRLYDLNAVGGVLVISMEYVSGETLRDALNRREGVSIRYGLSLIQQIAGGLGEAHAQGVIHRDLKPSNIHVTPDGDVKVMDFGIARSVDSHQTGTGLIVGTPAYMSPEQAEGRVPDARSDIYALGLVMFEVFCGEPVFTADSTTAMVAKHVGEKPRSPRELEPDLPRRIERAILRCLEKDPDRRFQSAAELIAALSDDSVRIARPGMIDVELPAHLRTWQRLDWSIAGLAAMALAATVMLAPGLSVLARTPVTFDHSVLLRIAQEHLQRLQLPAAAERSWHVDTDPLVYNFVAQTRGMRDSLQLAVNHVPLVSWHVMLADDANITVDSRGQLVSFNRPIADGGAPPVDSARAVAERAASETWRLTLSSLTVDRTTTGQQSHSFGWLNPGASGLTERYNVNVDRNGVQLLNHVYSPPPTYRYTAFSSADTIGIVLTFIAAGIGLLHRKRFDLFARWRLSLSAFAFVVAIAFIFFYWTLSRVVEYSMVGFGFGLIAALVTILVSVAIEATLVRTGPERLRSLIDVGSGRFRSKGVGLAIVRGGCLGLIVAGVDSALISLITSTAPVWVDQTHFTWMSRQFASHWPSATVLTRALMLALEAGLLVSLATGLVDRLVPRRWLAFVVAVIVVTLIGINLGFGRVQPFYWRLPIAAADFIVLIAAFRRFDVLTVMAATFMMWFASGIIPVVMMLRPSGTIWPDVAWIVVACITAGAVLVAFENRLTFAYRRLSGSLE